jgi:hypothetical protein
MSEGTLSGLRDLLDEFPALKRLHDWAAQRAISIQVEPATIKSNGYEPRLLTISSPAVEPIRFVAFDDYINARSDNVLLSLILLESDVAELNYGEDLKYWTGVNYLDADDAEVKQVFAANLLARNGLIEAFGPIPDAKFNWELEMGVDVGDLLRALKITVADQSSL